MSLFRDALVLPTTYAWLGKARFQGVATVAVRVLSTNQTLESTDAAGRQWSRVPALNMEEVELLSPTGEAAWVWLGDESQGGLGVLVLGAAVGSVPWLQVGVHVGVRYAGQERLAIVRHCTLDSPTVMFVGMEWVCP